MTFISTRWEYRADECGGGIEPVAIDRVKGLYHGQEGIRYAVRQHGAAMNAEGDWIIEPMPSSRDDDYLDEFRFETWEAAANAILKHVKHPWGRMADYDTGNG